MPRLAACLCLVATLLAAAGQGAGLAPGAPEAPSTATGPATAATGRAPVAVLAADWPRLWGPDGLGISPETDLARAWPPAGPRTLWSISVNHGYAGVAIHGGEVFLLDREGDGRTARDILRVLDLDTGKEKWSFAYEAPGPLPYPGSRNTPTVTDALIFTIGPMGHLHCLDRRTHNRVWSRHLLTDFPGAARMRDTRPTDKPPRWGFTQAPLLFGDLVIVAPQGAQVGVAALEQRTGRVRWESGAVGRNWFAHVTPTLATLDGVPQIITVANAHGYKDPPAILSGVDASTGERLWRKPTWKRYNVPIPSPVAVGPNRLFFSGGYRIGCFALDVRRKGATWHADFSFQDNDNLTAHMHNPVFYQGHIYGQSFDKFHNEVNNGLVCLDPDGRLRWRTGPEVPFESGAFLIADGLIFVQHGKTGELALYEASPRAAVELARAKVLGASGGEAWGPMALSRGKLIVRDLATLKCLDVRQP